MSRPKTLTEAEIRGLLDGAAKPYTKGDLVSEMEALRLQGYLRAAAPDLAHTALEAMRRERILMRALLDPDLCAYCCHEDCAATFRAVDPTSGLRYCDAHAPAGSVRVVP